MKIVVNSGRTIHRGVKAGKKATFATDGSMTDPGEPPVVTKHKPGDLLDVPDAEAKQLIARGAASKYEPPKAVEAEKTEK